MNFEKLLGHKFSKTKISIRFNLLHVFPSVPSFVFAESFIGVSIDKCIIVKLTKHRQTAKH